MLIKRPNLLKLGTLTGSTSLLENFPLKRFHLLGIHPILNMNQKSHLQRKVLPQKKAAEVEGAEAADMGKARKKETHTAKTQRSSLLAQIGER